MEKQLVDQKFGPETELKIELVDGGLKLSVAYVGTQTEVGLYVIEKPHALLEKLKAAIPGSFDDVVINLVEAETGM